MTTKARIISLLFSLLIAGLLSLGLKHYYDKAGQLAGEITALKKTLTGKPVLSPRSHLNLTGLTG